MALHTTTTTTWPRATAWELLRADLRTYLWGLSGTGDLAAAWDTLLDCSHGVLIDIYREEVGPTSWHRATTHFAGWLITWLDGHAEGRRGAPTTTFATKWRADVLAWARHLAAGGPTDGREGLSYLLEDWHAEVAPYTLLTHSAAHITWTIVATLADIAEI